MQQRSNFIPSPVFLSSAYLPSGCKFGVTYVTKGGPAQLLSFLNWEEMLWVVKDALDND